MILAHFPDAENGGFYDTSDDHEALIQRPKDVQDNATPSANAMAAQVLLKLSLYTGNGRYWDVAEQAVAGLYQAMAQYPSGFAHWMGAAAFILGEPQEVAIVGDEADELLDVVFGAYRPNLVVAAGDGADGAVVPLLQNRGMKNGRATAYVCRRFVCQQPVMEADELVGQLDGQEMPDE